MRATRIANHYLAFGLGIVGAAFLWMLDQDGPLIFMAMNFR